MTQRWRGTGARLATACVLAGMLGLLTLAGSSSPTPEARSPVQVVATGFTEPTGLSVDRLGQLLVSDVDAGKIYRLTPGVDPTGNPIFIRAPVSSALKRPAGITLTSDGDLLVADVHTGRVVRFSKNGDRFDSVPRLVADGAKGPRWLTVSTAGDIFVSAADVERPRRPGEVVLQVVAGQDFAVLADRFDKLEGLVFRHPNTLLAAARRRKTGDDARRGAIYEIALSGSTVQPLATAGFIDPQDLKLDAMGSLFVSADAENIPPGREKGAILKITFDETGHPIATTVFASKLGSPAGLAFDAEGHLYAAERKFGRLLRFEAPAPAALYPPLPRFTRNPVATVKGTAEPAAVVTVLGGRQRVSTAPLPANGTFSIDVPLKPNADQILHVFVIGSRGDGLASKPVDVQITHDDTPPETQITEGPTGTISTTTATFRFAGTDNLTESSALSFSYSLDGAPFSTFSFSTAVTFDSLADGQHTFGVKARDEAENEDATPATRTFTTSGAPAISTFTPIDGPVGTTVTITGRRFDPVPRLNEVRFNGTRALILSATDTTITTSVPQGADTGPIAVTTSRGTTTTVERFTVTSRSDFHLRATPPMATTAPGAAATYLVTVDAVGSFTGLVTLGTTGLPLGAASQFASPALAPGQSALLTITPATTPAGQWTFTVTGTGAADRGSRTETLRLYLTVQSAGQTVLTGQVLEGEGRPIQGVTLRLGDNGGQALGTTDEAGRFFLSNVSAGTHVLLVDGSTANTAEVTYSTVPVTVDLQPGVVNALGFTPRLHAQKRARLQPIQVAQTTVIKEADIPGFAMTIPAGVQIIGWDGQPNTKVTVTAIPIDQSPLPPVPPGHTSRVVYLFSFGKVGGGVPTGNVVIDTANDVGGLPGDKIDLYYYNEAPDGTAPNRWEKYGTGTVSGDGSTIVTDINPATGKQYGMPRFCCGARRNEPPPPQLGASTGANGGPIGGGTPAADPVDAATGFLTQTDTDLVVQGLVPLIVQRSYRTNLSGDGAFGVGSSWSYDVFLQPPPNGSPDALVLYMPGNRQAIFGRQPDGSFINTTAPALRSAVCTTRFGNRIVTFRDRTTWTFDASGRLIETSDRNGNRLTITRDSQGRITSLADPTGRRIVASYRGQLLIDRITDPAGRTVTYDYDGSNRLTTVRHAQGGRTLYTYDALNRLLTVTDPRGTASLRNEYDAAGRVSKQTLADGGIFTLTYTSVGDFVASTTVTDPRGNATTHRFNSFGYLVSQTDALGQTTTLTRDPATNLILAQRDPLGRTTSFTYDALGNVASVTDATGAITRYAYDATFNQLVEMTDALGNVQRFELDGRGNLVARMDALGHRTELSYNSVGQPLAVTNSAGESTRFEYDAPGNLVGVIDPGGSRWARGYDNLSRPVSFTNLLGATSAIGYDNLDQIVSVTDALGGVTLRNYDPNGNLLRLTDANGHATNYAYDGMNRVAGRSDALGRQESFAYDPAGNLTSHLDRSGQVATFAYDRLNRRVLASYADGLTNSFIYNATGRLTRAEDSRGESVAISYDAVDRLLEEISPSGIVAYSYDALGRRGSMTVNGRRNVTYAYDGASRLTTIQEGPDTVQFSYDAGNRKTQILFPNGTRTSHAYDSAGRVSRILHDGPNGVIDDLSYAYDALGQPISIARAGGSATGMPQPFDAAYDAANQLARFNSVSPNVSYDPNGRLSSYNLGNGTTTFTWSGRGDLTSVAGPTTAAVFAYDALGRRSRSAVNGSEIRYQHDGLNLVSDFSDRGQADYVFDLQIDAPLQRRGPSTVAYHTDALGSVVDTTDQGGAIANRYTYDPFGGTSQTGADQGNSLEFTSRERDATGLYYYRARYYSTLFQRFASEDPVEALNRYSYVDNNPLVAIDPLGLEADARAGGSEFWQQFVKGAHETAIGEFEGFEEALGRNITFGLWQPDVDVSWMYAYGDCLECSESYWQGRATGRFALEFMTAYRGPIGGLLGKWHTANQMGRIPNSFADAIRHSNALLQEGRSINALASFGRLLKILRLSSEIRRMWTR